MFVYVSISQYTESKDECLIEVTILRLFFSGLLTYHIAMVQHILCGCILYKIDINNYIEISYVIINRCLQLNFSENFCADFSLATDSYGYQYTSSENLTGFISNVNVFVTYFDLYERCQFFAAYYLCNYVIVPCDLFTGAPRPMCSDSCYYLTTECGSIYSNVSSLFINQVYPACG